MDPVFRHIVLLDTSASARFTAKRSLLRYSGQPIEFSEAENLTEALHYLRERTPDCLILDFYLGEVSGLDVLEQIKLESGLLPCPVVMLTGNLSSGQDALLSLKAGAHDTIEKIRLMDPTLWKTVLYARSRYEITSELLARAEKLSHINRELDLKNRLKTRFLANATHDLRTPLSAICGIVELARQEHDISLIHRYLETIDSCCGSLMNSIDDVLDLVRIETNEFVLDQSSIILSELLEEVRDSLSLRALERKTVLSVQCPPQDHNLLGDARRIKQILTNLVGNALKYTTAGHIIIRAFPDSAEDRSKQQVDFCFEVEDDGAGIPEADIPHLFERYFRAGNSQDESGSGLGLDIVKGIVTMMGGTLGCRSALGRGSTFWFRITLQTEHRRPPSTSPLESSPTRILVAEDNIVLAHVICQQLKNLGCEVTLAQDGVAAIELFPSRPFDLLLFDARMPRLGGLEACREIRSRFQTDVPIVLLTADSMLSHTDLGAYGITKAFVKPLPENEIREKLLPLVW